MGKAGIVKRAVIESVEPQVDCGKFPIKRIVGQRVTVSADIFADGHDNVAAQLLYRHKDQRHWQAILMEYVINDRWEASFTVENLGIYFYTIEAWVDRFQTWLKDVKKKSADGQALAIELKVGCDIIRQAAGKASNIDSESLLKFSDALRTDRNSIDIAENAQLKELMGKYGDKSQVTSFEKNLEVCVDRPKALFSTWYELFPRSAGQGGKYGTFRDCIGLLPKIADMGFDVLYLPPIHPIGWTNRKGKNNSVKCDAGDPGSPWAIGAKEGGHKSIEPRLGTMDEFHKLISEAKKHGIEIALDLAFQCSPDHPYVTQHPEWFRWRPDGKVQFAENPPKKYEDIVPFDFETDKYSELTEELKSVVEFWIENGINIFRADNPHTKPFEFWYWLISEIKSKNPGIIFLAEAFTRPKVMQRLAKMGFTQSYTYFTWRNTKHELTQYLTELTKTDTKEYMRPNFWPNTPDILPQYLQYGGKSAFIIRLVLAATLSSNYGIYGPAFELCLNQERAGEYLGSEKYEIKNWDTSGGGIEAVVKRVNTIRSENPALQETNNLCFLDFDNEMIMAYAKSDCDSNLIITVVNLDPYHKQSGWLTLPLEEFDISSGQPYMLHDLLSNDKYIWQGERNYMELEPRMIPAHILRMHSRLRRETDFDYFV